MEKEMTMEEACKLVGERVVEIIKHPEVQKKMLELGREKGEQLAYQLAIATLFGQR